MLNEYYKTSIPLTPWIAGNSTDEEKRIQKIIAKQAKIKKKLEKLAKALYGGLNGYKKKKRKKDEQFYPDGELCPNCGFHLMVR